VTMRPRDGRVHGRDCLRAGLAVMIILAGSTAPAPAQGLAVDLSAGSVVYEPLATNVRASTVIGTLRYDSQDRFWIFGSGGVPLRSGDSSWMSAGSGGRLQRARAGRRPRAGIDIGAHGYLFRDAIVAARGSGAALDALPFVSLPAGPGAIEVRAGWRGHTLSYAGLRESRGVIETGIRTVHGNSTFRAEVDAKWVRASEGGFPFAGAALTYAGRPVQIWLRAGRWLDADLDEVSWSAGAGVAAGARALMWARVWQDAPDPLYWNVPRRSWSVGVTHGIGRQAGVDSPFRRTRSRDGSVVLALPVSEARLPALFIAGDFTGWQPRAMTREGGVWVIRARLEPGVYRYAFRTAEGRWFVPESVPGRADDGMGGHVAILVVG
jgi:hypothetical protein